MSTSSLLWSIQPPGGRQSFLFGTMHIKDERVYAFCDKLYPLIQQSDVYVAEMDMHDITHPLHTPTYDLRHFFRPMVYQKLRKQLLKSFKIDIHRFAHLHPLMIMSAISHSILENDHTVSLDEHLWHFAGGHQLSLQGLESVAEQMELLHSIEPGPLYRQIKEISVRPEKLRSFTKRALELYTSGDVHQLYLLTKSSMHQLRKRIIYDRNKLMLHRIKSFDSSLSYFIAVGAGHLSGPTGLIRGLRHAGYGVKAISSLNR